MGGLLWLGFFTGANVLAALVFIAFGKALQWISPAGASSPMVVLVVCLAALVVSIALMVYAVRVLSGGSLRRTRNWR